jgi:hypothetical protein
MEVMEIRKVLIIVLFMIHFCACSAQKSEPIKGGVYVSNQLLNNKEVSRDSIYPILAMRIDTIINDTLLVKYRFGKEAIMDVNFRYQQSCNCYESIGNISFAPYGKIKQKVYLEFDKPEKLKLYYKMNGIKNSYKYFMTYVDKINLKIHRSIYHAEDGFKLFKEK